MTDGDRELARRFPAADDDVIRDVYARFGGAVHTVAISIVREPARAADVVQSTFLNAWRAAATFDPSRELGPWLYTIARRQAIDAYRKERHLTVTDPADLDIVDLPPSLERVWEAFQVRAAVDALDPVEREVMRLAWFEDLTHPDIADRLGIPIGTVKSRSHRAQRRLAVALAHLRTPSAPNQSPVGDVVSDNRASIREGKHE